MSSCILDAASMLKFVCSRDMRATGQRLRDGNQV